MGHVYPDILAPSLLAGDHGNLLESARLVKNLGLEWLHVDIMDGHFVPNLTFGPETVAALDRELRLFYDVHLMLERPDQFIDAFADAGADAITVHVEPGYPIAETLKRIRELELFAGISLKPATPAETLLPFLGQVDMVLVMTVEPGFGGQSFLPGMLSKIETVAQWRRARGLEYRIEVDGGINEKNAALCREAGADTFVAGTSFFAAADKPAFIRAIQGDAPENLTE